MQVDSTSEERSDASISGSLFDFDPPIESVLPVAAHPSDRTVPVPEDTALIREWEALFDEPCATGASHTRHPTGRSAVQKGKAKKAARAPRATTGSDAAPSTPPHRVRSRASPEVQRVTVRKVAPSYVQESQMSPAKKKRKGSRLRACRQSKKRCTNLETFAQEQLSLPKLLAWDCC